MSRPDPQYEYYTATSVDHAELSELAAEGWRVVAGQPCGRASWEEGTWDCLLERVVRDGDDHE